MKRFSDTDKAFLKSNYPNMSRIEIANKLGFSVGQIGYWINKLKIKQKQSHKMSNHPLYNVWMKINYRCYGKGCKQYKYYGARGIKMCDEWKKDFKKFYNWCLLNGWNKKLEIDRKDNDGDYSPNNCRITTKKINCNNRSNCIILTAFGESKTIKQWSEDSRCKVKYYTLINRINMNYDHEFAIITPPGIKKNQYVK